jgi:hypothetical protein
VDELPYICEGAAKAQGPSVKYAGKAREMVDDRMIVSGADLSSGNEVEGSKLGSFPPLLYP